MFQEKIITKVGYIETTLPFTFFNELLMNIDSYEFKKTMNDNLAGQIENEKWFDYDLIPKGVKKIILDGCHEYIKVFGHNYFKSNSSKNYNLNFLNSWVNFQRKGEYNPIHWHYGDLVFVIWIKIPYELEDELNHKSSVGSNHKVASKFEFANISNRFSNIINRILDVDKSYEGRLIIFHADMEHTVYPFLTSNDDRVSMSGNLKIELQK